MLRFYTNFLKKFPENVSSSCCTVPAGGASRYSLWGPASDREVLGHIDIFWTMYLTIVQKPQIFRIRRCHISLASKIKNI